jgi:hypothetical protein
MFLYKNKKGFSYIELMMVIFVIMVVSAVTIFSFNRQGGPGELFVSAQKLVSDIRLAQGYAMSAKEIDGDSPAGGWGIFFDKNRDEYAIFGDKGTISDIANYVCILDCSNLSEELYSAIDFPEGTHLDQIILTRTSDGNEIFVDKINIVFEPPDPKVHLCVAEGDCDYDKVSLVLVDESFNKREINVNFFGLIDTNEIAY